MYVDWLYDVDHQKPEFYSNSDIKILLLEYHVSFDENRSAMSISILEIHDLEDHVDFI